MADVRVSSEKFAAAWRRAPEMVAEVLTRRLLEAELLYQRETVERTPAGVGGGGGLRGSIQAGEPALQGQRLEGAVGTPLAYAAPVEFGSRPHMPPIAPLVPWVVERLGLTGDEAEEVARRIAWKIKARGTEGAHMFEGAMDATGDQITAILARALDEIGARLTGADR